MRRSSLVDQFGRPVGLTTFFEGGDRFRGGDSGPINYWNGAVDLEQLFPSGTWQQAMSAGRNVFANFSPIRGALLEQASYSFPLEPHYMGKDQAWGKLAKQWLFEWTKSADVRGPAFDSWTSARIRLLARKTDGDIGRILTFDPQDNYPRLQFVRAHRIGSAQLGDGPVKEGRYKGYPIRNGVITDGRGRPVAYRVLTGKSSWGGVQQTDFEDVPAASMLLTFNPEYSDQWRGMSEIMAAVPMSVDLKRLHEYEMRAQQIQSQNAVTEENEDGEAPPGTDPTIKTGNGMTIETLDRGLTRYYRSMTGSKLNLLRPDRPGEGCFRFRDETITAMFYGIEWDPFFALAIKEPGAGWARMLLQKVNRAIANNVRIEARDQLREHTYGLAGAIDLKILPAPSDGDIWSWDYSGPPKITCDTGNDESAKREKYKLGALTLQRWVAEDGGWWDEVRDQKERETVDLLERARKVQTQFPELSLQECVQLLEQRTPNGPTSVGATAPDEAAGADDEKANPNK